VLAATDKILVGTSVATSWKRHPMQLAETAASLDRLFPGRFAVGVGSGVYFHEAPRMWMQPRERPVGRMKEYIELIRRALSGEEVNHRGEFFGVAGAVSPAPKTDIPIYMAAGGPQMARLAGRTADGVFIHFGSSHLLTEIVANVHEGADRAGRARDAVRVCQLVPVCVADDRTAALEGLRDHTLYWYLSDPYYRRLLGESGFPEVVERVEQRLDADDLKGAEAGISNAALEAFCLPLTVDEPADDVWTKLDRVLARGVDEVVVYPCPVQNQWAKGYADAIELFGRVRRGDAEPAGRG
jgi:alkanesulfonate monooxygenase SsuD/methylene tetrahydromethanopterin reductase-like flavin-dependent oxidoreductase (luciferase family)